MKLNNELNESTETWSLGRLEYLDSCPFCNAETHESKAFSRQDDTSSLPDIWTLNQCNACTCIYLNPRPDAESLPKAYQNYYTHAKATDEQELRDNSLLTRLINGYLNHRFSMKRPNASRLGAWLFRLIPPLRMALDVYGRHITKHLCNSDTQLLDVGCGNGSYLLKAQEMGVTAYGQEIDPTSQDNFQAAGLNVHIGDLESANYANESFDYITLNHVIEHVQGPQELLLTLKSILKEGGTLWLNLPNASALGIKVFGKAWINFHPPFHLLIPSQPMLKSWLEQAGFEDIQFIRRSIQSKGLWKESEALYFRENKRKRPLIGAFFKFLADMLSIVSTRYSEETIVIAKRPKEH